MNMQTGQPARDAEHFHNPAAVATFRASPMAMAAFRRHLRDAIRSFPEGTLAVELAAVLQQAVGSKGKAFNVLDAAIKEVMK